MIGYWKRKQRTCRQEERVTDRLLAEQMKLSVEEVTDILNELCSYRLIRRMKVTDTDGSLNIYYYETAGEWIRFLFFASGLMHAPEEVRLMVNLRHKAAFDAPLGTKNAYPVWNKSTEQQEQMNLMKES